MDRDGKQLITGSFDDVVISAPTFASPSPSPEESPTPDTTSPPPAGSSGPPTTVEGSYTITWGDGIGGCGATPPPTEMTVSTSGTSITVALGSSLTMTGPVSDVNTFQVSYTNSSGTQFSMNGTFVVSQQPVTINNAEYTVGNGDSGCGYQFTAIHN
jgi:hypothetical protein